MFHLTMVFDRTNNSKVPCGVFDQQWCGRAIFLSGFLYGLYYKSYHHKSPYKFYYSHECQYKKIQTVFSRRSERKLTIAIISVTQLNSFLFPYCHIKICWVVCICRKIIRQTHKQIKTAITLQHSQVFSNTLQANCVISPLHRLSKVVAQQLN